MQILQLPRQDPGPGLSWGWPEAAPLAFLPPAVRRDAACPDTADTGPGLPRYQDYLVFSTLTCTHIMNLWDWNYITFPFALGTLFLHPPIPISSG